MARILVAFALAISTVSSVPAQAPAPFDLKILLDQYLRGDRDAAVAKAAAMTDLGPLRLRFVQDTPGWAIADPANVEARRAAVAGFLIELAGVRFESDWGRLSDLIEWTCVQLRTAGPPTEFERTWHAASHALAGRARVRQWMLGEYAVLPHQKPMTKAQSDARMARMMRNASGEPPPAEHLMHALERFPDDPHFQLTRVVAWTWGRDSEPTRNVRRRDDDRPVRVRRAPQLEAVVALEPLTAIDAVAAEAFFRTGMVQFTVNDFASALKAFERSQAIATEPAIKYMAALSAGRALEALSRPEDAMRAYQDALAIVPQAESATIALAALQFSRDDRDAAVAMIDTVFNRKPSPADPGRMIGYGSYIRWPELKAAMRTALSSYPGVSK